MLCLLYKIITIFVYFHHLIILLLLCLLFGLLFAHWQSCVHFGFYGNTFLLNTLYSDTLLKNNSSTWLNTDAIIKNIDLNIENIGLMGNMGLMEKQGVLSRKYGLNGKTRGFIKKVLVLKWKYWFYHENIGFIMKILVLSLNIRQLN